MLSPTPDMKKLEPYAPFSSASSSRAYLMESINGSMSFSVSVKSASRPVLRSLMVIMVVPCWRMVNVMGYSLVSM